MSSELLDEFVADDFDAEGFEDEEFTEPDLPIWDEDGRIHLTRTTNKGG